MSRVTSNHKKLGRGEEGVFPDPSGSAQSCLPADGRPLACSTAKHTRFAVMCFGRRGELLHSRNGDKLIFCGPKVAQLSLQAPSGDSFHSLDIG